jgi:polar amino acid transport system substrate-binding protein
MAADIWCPITCDPNTDAPGYMVEIARMAFAKAGHTVTYEVLPWTRAIKEGRDGDITGIIGAYHEDAPDFIFPENELGLLGNEMFVQTENPWRYTGIVSLENITLGVIADYAYSEELNAYILAHQNDSERIQIATGESPLESNIHKLERGRLTAVLETTPVFWYTVGQLELNDRFRSAGIATEPQKAYIAFSPVNSHSAEYARILSEGIAALRASGELARILQKYHLEDWKP